MSNPNPYRFGSEVVRACAGAGKTTRLSKRIIKLLVNDVPPEEIIALTFTRAAASEFVSRLLKMLASGASSQEGAAKLAKDLELPATRKDGGAWDQAFFQVKLKQTLQSINRMTLGTLDSFFAKIVANNPTELGLDVGQVRTAGELDGPAIRAQITKRALEQIFQRDPVAIKTRLAELKLMKESATPLTDFEKLVEDLHETFLLTHNPKVWGLRGTIWPKGSKLFDAPKKGELQKAIAHLLAWLPKAKAEKDYARNKTEAHLDHLISSCESGEEPSDTAINYFHENFKEALNASPGTPAICILKAGRGSATIELGPDECAAYQILVRGALSSYFEKKSTQTKAAFALLKVYDIFYRDELRKSGQLGFSDYVNLLLSLPEEKKLDLEYRLDCKFRHWLFDEFQDTSSRQWKVLGNHLAESTKKKDEWSTTYFVGDPKQSLYSWRGGNPKLLGQREEQTRQEYGESAIVPLKQTYRCAQPIVDMVNDLLGQPTMLTGVVPDSARDAWDANFAKHVSAVQKEKSLGEALWVRLPKPEDKTTLQAQAAWIVEHLRSSGLTEGRYLKPGFTCAVLVSGNEDAAALSETMRTIGLEAADEADTPIAMDNPLTAGFVSILRNCVHPDDKLSEGLANMSPTAKAYVDAAGGWESCRAKVADLFYAKGAAETLRMMTEGVDLSGGSKAKPEEANSWNFLRMRLRQLLTLGAKYDEQGERDLRGAVEYIEQTSLRDNADPAAVQVLTIHRSKGLQYTAVYLPCLNDSYHFFGKERDRAPLSLDDPDTFKPKWILHRPAKPVRQLDPEFLKAQVAEQSDEAYEALCKIYVGMTRAERRLVLITEAVDEENSPKDTYDYAKMIEKILGKGMQATGNEIARHCGDAGWITLVEPTSKPKEGTEAGLVPPKVEFKAVESPEKFLPSDKKEAKRYPFRSRTKVDLTKPKGKDIGNVIHALMEPLEWDIHGFLSDLQRKSPGNAQEALHQHAKAIIESCLKSKTVAAALSAKPEGCTLLKERKFSLLMVEGKIVTGNADRIHLVPGKSAVIFDYKSDTCDLEELKAKHARQMDMYRTATSRIWGIPKDKIQCLLIHVRKGELVEC
jgi:ATP-dependent exoDNAse (exonuclease V) beta subunit